MWTRIWLGVFLAAALVTEKAGAEVPLEGYFIARDRCPAFQSFRRQTNPGNMQTESDRAYDLHSKNAEVASHYLIEYPGATPSRRWVAITCGQHVVLASSAGDGENHEGDGDEDNGEGNPYVLAVSWQPGFCETRPQKPECVSMTPDRFDATHFTLHGLWPQPRDNLYCDVDPGQVTLDKNGRWTELEALDLAPETRAELEVVMPGTQSGLHRHEWIKHGSCYGDGAQDKYFRDSLALMNSLNNSGVKDLFEAHIGQDLDINAIRDAFDAEFGEGSGNRVDVSCKRDDDRLLITELRLQLHGTISEQPDLGELLRAAPPTGSRCARGVVDPAGFQ